MTMAFCATTAVAPHPGARVSQAEFRKAAVSRARYGPSKRYSRERFNVNGQKFLQVRENASGRFSKPSWGRGRNEYSNVNRAERRQTHLFGADRVPSITPQERCEKLRKAACARGIQWQCHSWCENGERLSDA
jgi:hypothetical protein